MKTKKFSCHSVQKEPLSEQNDDTFCSTMLKLICDKKVPSDKYFTSDNGLLPKVVREDNKIYHALRAPITFCKYVFHQVHDA